MKKIIIGTLIAIMILSVQQIWAQKSPSDKIDHLKTELDLTEDQVAQLEKIFESKHEEKKTLKSAEYKSEEEKHKAMQNFRQSMEKEIASVLNEEQLAKFQEIKMEHRGEHGRKGKEAGHRGHLKDGKGQALRAQIKAYKEQNIKPVMLEQRAKLEPKISKADKELIAEMRVNFEKMKAERKAHFGAMENDPEKGEVCKKQHKEERKNIDEAKREQLKALVEKYQGDIQPLFDEVADQQEKWEKDIQKIFENSLDEDDDRMERHGEFHGDRKEMMKMGRFLMLDPNEKVGKANAKNLVSNITAFPNPASTTTTVKYEVLESGKVLIELRDNKGKLLKTVKNDYHEKGTYQVTIALESYQSDLFYVIIQDKNGVSSTKDIVRVR